jgi:hypothetical protein
MNVSVKHRSGLIGISLADRQWRGDAMNKEKGAIGYIFLWLMGVPATVLFLIFLLRGCN